MATYNFGAASSQVPLVFGVEAPGVPLKPGGNYNDPSSVPNDVVLAWIEYLKANGITRTLCLLKPEELACYADPGYASLLESNGIKPVLVDVFAPGAKDGIVAALTEAEDASEKLAVHCSGGEGRTGVALAFWLHYKCGLSAEDAEKEVLESASSQGVARKVGVAKVIKLTESGTLAK